jgi:D-threonate/D-erythronate kinase
MAHLRLIADDLTGALDAAAQFATPERAIPVFLNGRLPASLPGSFAIDGGTRERDGIFAAAAATRHASIFAPRPGTISFKKMDSLLRGHCGPELVAILRAVPAARCVIAPAFPFHGRVTRDGLQFELRDGSWHRVGEDLRAKLESEGIAVRLVRAGGPVPEGASLWDAETDDDLRRIADAGRRLSAPVLWCGSGGLAMALAGGEAPAAGELARPILGLFGSDHPATAVQLRACGRHVLRLSDGGGESAALVSSRLGAAGACLVAFDLPAGMARSAASGHIAREIARLVQGVPPPGSLLVSGGETLGALCLSLRTDHLEVVGQVIPGVPVSVMRGGHWDLVRVVSKSGAFGHDKLLLGLLGQDAER